MLSASCEGCSGKRCGCSIHKTIQILHITRQASESHYGSNSMLMVDPFLRRDQRTVLERSRCILDPSWPVEWPDTRASGAKWTGWMARKKSARKNMNHSNRHRRPLRTTSKVSLQPTLGETLTKSPGGQTAQSVQCVHWAYSMRPLGFLSGACLAERPKE